MAKQKPGKYWDKAWSLVDGCTPVSEACDNCWLDRMHRLRGAEPGTMTFREDRLDIPLKRQIPTVYAIWSDLFHEEVEWNQQFKAFQMMAHSSQHTFLILTKRPDIMAKHMSNIWFHIERHHIVTPFDNVWLGVTAENQRTADERIPLLLQTPAAHRFVSVEPMLGPVDLTGDLYKLKTRKPSMCSSIDYLDLVIIGGESGPKARPMHPDWARSVRDQCESAGVPFFFKQWGKWLPESQLQNMKMATWMNKNYKWDCESSSYRVGNKNAGRLLDGREHNDLPWRVE